MTKVNIMPSGLWEKFVNQNFAIGADGGYPGICEWEKQRKPQNFHDHYHFFAYEHKSLTKLEMSSWCGRTENRVE